MRAFDELVQRLCLRKEQELGGLSEGARAELELAVRADPSAFVSSPADEAFGLVVQALERHEAAAQGEDLLDDEAYFTARAARLARLERDCNAALSVDENCLDAACFGGRVAVIGVGKHNIDLDFTIIQKKELNIYGSRNALTRDFEELIDTVKNQGLKLDKVVTNVYPFAQAAQAFEDFHQNAGSMLKVMIEF